LHWDKAGTALKVYKIKGNVEGTNTFDLSDWQTGSGGVWEHWSVNNGTFITTVGTQINCILSVDEVAEIALNFYPNPVKNELYITAEKPLKSIVLLDSFGRIVIQKEASGERETSLNVSKLSSGTYFLKVQVNNAIIIKKVIK